MAKRKKSRINVWHVLYRIFIVQVKPQMRFHAREPQFLGPCWKAGRTFTTALSSRPILNIQYLQRLGSFDTSLACISTMPWSTAILSWYIERLLRRLRKDESSVWNENADQDFQKPNLEMYNYTSTTIFDHSLPLVVRTVESQHGLELCCSADTRIRFGQLLCLLITLSR